MTLEVLAGLLVLNLLATFSLWQTSPRRPEKPKKRFLKALLHSEAIKPIHQQPKWIGEGFSSLVRDEDKHFFEDFRDFGRVVNWWLADRDTGGPWRLQELSITELSLQLSDMPHFGRRYAIFHNQVSVGILEVSPDGLGYSAGMPRVSADIEIEWVRLLSFHTIRAFLDSIALHVSDPSPNTPEHLQTEVCIDRAMNEVVWQTQQISERGMDGESYGTLELRLHGLANWYFERRHAPGMPAEC